MKCDKLPLAQLVSGELPLWTRVLLRWHGARCASCRSQYRQAQDVLCQLRHLAIEQVSTSLRRRVLDAVPNSLVQPGGSGIDQTARTRMRRTALIALGATLVFAVTGALVAKYLSTPSFGCSDRLGRTWHVAGDFHGQVTLLDARGEPAMTATSGYGEMKEPVEVTTSGETVTVQGVGRHEIRGKDGTLFGFAVLRPLSEQEYLALQGQPHLPTSSEALDRQARDWADPNWDTHGGASGAESAPWGVRGFNLAARLRWRVLGTGDVQVFAGTGKRILGSAHTVPSGMALPASLQRYTEAGEPELLVTLGGRSWKESGYGTHLLKDDAGRVLLTAEILPESR
jgi:hypothetical protein